MTDIIKLAREAGATPYTNRHYPDRPTHTFNAEQLERFAELVAKQEREAKESPCKTCKHFTQGKNPLVGTFEMQCFKCTNYYASKWEAKEQPA